MGNYLKSEVEINKEVDKIHKEIQPALYEYNPKSKEAYEKTEKGLNSKILEITMQIKDQCPELSKYIEEMRETIPDKKNPEITLKNLQTYYDSLKSMLNKYILEHPDNPKQKK